MVTFILVLGLVSMPVIAFIFTRLWIMCGYLWCLEVYPEWLDRFIYSKALPYLSADMTEAASQMEFIEVWIASTVILETFFLFTLFLLNPQLRDDDLISHKTPAQLK
jgi:hypothetical protein